MHIPRISVLTLTCALSSACGSDSISGIKDGQTEITLDFCGLPPEWLAIQNEGEGWQRVNAGTDGIVKFGATPKVSLAFAFGDFGFFSTLILNTTAEELKAEVPCDQSFGTRTLTATLAGLTGEQAARVTVDGQTASADAANPSVEFDFLPSTGVDLIALRFASFFSSPADKVIIRRALIAQNVPIATLDFSAAEAQPLASAVLTLANMGSDFAFVTTEFMSSGGALANLSDMSLIGGTTAIAYPAVPSPLLQQGDLHRLTATVSSSTGVREVTHFYRTPSNATITFGPHLGVPTVSQLSTSPYLRLRALLASQPEYPTAAQFGFSQSSQTEFHSVDILTTAGFHGGAPSTWEFVIPDFVGTGYQSSWGLQNGMALSWDATAFNSGSNVLANAPTDGQTVSSAVRSSTTSFAEESIRGSRSHVRRSLYRR